jgi:hypothetical protein
VKRVHLDDVERIPIVDGRIQWLPLRRTLGIEAFGINAYTAASGEEVVEDHDETASGAGGHEELYVVVSGRATFVVDGEEVDAPAGTLVFLDDPAERRAARAEEDGTVVLAIGGAPGAPFRVSPWEYYFAAIPALRRRDWDEAERLHLEGLEQYPDHPVLLYDLACIAAQRGDRAEAFRHLAAAAEAGGKVAEWAATDTDLDPVRDDPRFASFVGA